ncbi:glycoside hydrolase family 2 protein [Azospirillum brasilense]|uniref:glycoside hydrolase family 2 protein n=1 Tax=Azospirillum brasilense TaxID=192 RepID=UPI00190A2677|nr:glycoside hydrolase family 2 protein [Azospirillum brasilense]
MARLHAVTGRCVTPLSEGWELCVTEPGAVPGGDWLPAPVPGTVAQALRAAGLYRLGDPLPLHDRDVWYRLRLTGEGACTLRFHGLATVTEVWLDGKRILSSDSMFQSHDVPVTLRGTHALRLVFRALNPVLTARKGRGRWPVRLAEPAGLRTVRTTLLGHMPGWCPPVPAVGPWRPVELITEDGPLRVRSADLRATLEGRDGRLSLTLAADWGGSARPPGWLEVGEARAPLRWTGQGELSGELRLPEIEPWWPHSHGKPTLHAVRAAVGEERIDLGRTGFRRIEREPGDDFALRINGERVFCRGACWSSPDIVALPGTRDAYAPWLELARQVGMTMLRVPGIAAYEADAFFDLCDAMGILVWQDFMFANFDYPADEPFLDGVRQEAAQFLDRVQASPSLAVLCGGSEAEQQAAMLGLPRERWSQPLFDSVLRDEAERGRPDVPYIANSPTGGPLPFAADAGVTHYYGVGAYLRPLEDARRAGVRFASECLAFANMPAAGALHGVPAVHDPRWKARVPRDPGAPWDFEDVRDHYLRTLHGVDPMVLRYEDPDRYARLSRAVTGEVMEAVFAEWRRAGSSCAGGLVWMFQDVWPGAGWGVVDSAGVPKAAWHALHRAFRPVQVLLTDEGVNGLAIHLLNETAEPVEAVLTLTALRRGEVPVLRAERSLTLPPRSAHAMPASSLADRFIDLTGAYRFGPPTHDSVVAALSDPRSGALMADAFHFLQGGRMERAELGLGARVERTDEGWALILSSRRLARSVHIEDDGFRGEEEWFHLPPGKERRLRLIQRHPGAAVPDGEVHALNGLDPTRYRWTA